MKNLLSLVLLLIFLGCYKAVPIHTPVGVVHGKVQKGNARYGIKVTTYRINQHIYKITCWKSCDIAVDGYTQTSGKTEQEAAEWIEKKVKNETPGNNFSSF